ncbi:MAG: NADH-dependent alcohol dehydrogenase [Bacteroidetes bacterium]|nr:MAG: NADH-dependent alcohol dehydrogenase [Bacteroidota bacterium]
MQNFEFYNPVKIIFGIDTLGKLSRLIPVDQHILLTYGGGSIKRNGVYDQVKKALSGHQVSEFGGIEANPEYETLLKAATLCRTHKIDFILSVGGGSVLDGTKFIAAAARYEGDPWDFFTKGVRVVDALPMGAVMTLPATGSEMNAGAVISRREQKEKRTFYGTKLMPRFAILDPQTTRSLPPSQRINGVVDSFVHIMEQYLTIDAGAWVSDAFSESLLNVLVEHGQTYVDDPENMDVAGNIMWASTMALNGLIRMGAVTDWSTHAIGHVLTAFYGLDHAITLAIVLPGVMQRMRNHKKEKLLRYAQKVWNLSEGSPETRIDKAIVQTEAFFRQLGAKTRFHEWGITEECPEQIAQQMDRIGLLPIGEHQNMDAAVIKEILTLRL